MRSITQIALVLGVLYLVYKAFYPDYAYRYRLELTLEMDGKAYTGSSVIDVKWIGGPSVAAHGAYAADVRLRGQAPIIDLGDRGIVIASLAATGNYGREDGMGAEWICGIAFGSDSSYNEIPKLPRLTGRRDLQPDGWPRLILLLNRSDPNAVRAFRPTETEAVFGKGTHFTSAFVEITSDPIIIDIDKKLPWYSSWNEKMRRQGFFISSPGVTTLFPNMLTADGS
jgi:hypothetical protein